MKSINQIYNEVSDHLTKNLSPSLTYHNVAHTQYVFNKVNKIAEKELIIGNELFLLQIAALFHDIGFVEGPKNHEKMGCKIANKWLQKNGFNDNQISQIHGMIMATKIPQTPLNHLECIIADADLFYLATSHFEFQSNNLRQEMKHFNSALTDSDFDKLQISFISKHSYHTNYCKRYFEYRKQNKLQQLISK